MRCFIAVEACEELEQEFKKAQLELKTDCARQKFVDKFHLTLKFLGDIDENKIDNIIKSLDNVKFPKFNSKLKSVGAFPSKNNPRVVWIGAEEKGFIELQKEIELSLGKFKFKKNNRFHPHFTLSRVRSVKDNACFTNKIDSIEINKIEFNVDKFKLIKSTLTPQGAVYDILKEFFLTTLN